MTMEPLFTPSWELAHPRFDDQGQFSIHVKSPSGFVYDVVIDVEGRWHIGIGEVIVPGKHDRRIIKRLVIRKLVELAAVSRDLPPNL